MLLLLWSLCSCGSSPSSSAPAPPMPAKVIATIPLGVSPNGVDVNSTTNRVYVANQSDGTVSVIDGGSNTVVSRVTVGSSPGAVAVNSVTNKIYVANSGDATVTVIDGNTNSTTSVQVGTLPVRIGVNSVTNKICLYGKNLRPVVYVLGDVAGEDESPVYAIQKMDKAIDQIKTVEGYHVKQYNIAMPTETDRLAMKWDGEWHITVEVFRDLGLAFAAVLVLIYILVVGWFRSFTVPLVIMAPIPLTLVGILPAHVLMGAFFTATSMIGFIAGAGIIVRNSIILVDFIELRREQGMTLEHAVVDAGAVRFRPMLLTAAAVLVGASVILFDPIFQGLAISLMAGEVASTLLSRMAVPVLYYMVEKHKRPAPGNNSAPVCSQEAYAWQSNVACD